MSCYLERDISEIKKESEKDSMIKPPKKDFEKKLPKVDGIIIRIGQNKIG